MIILGLAGRKRSGKDTSARLLASELGFRPVAFADVLREFAGEVFDLPPAYFGDALKEQSIGMLHVGAGHPVVTPRWLLQRLGQAGRKVFGPDFWIDRAFQKIQSGALGDCVVVTDVRHYNEALAVRKEGVLLRLNRLDRGPEHDFNESPDGTCDWQSPNGPCQVPRHAHPISWTADRHLSENDLPDSGDFYDHVIESDSADGSAAVVLEIARTEVRLREKKP